VIDRAAHTHRSTPVRLLYVEDDEDIRSGLAFLLTNEGYDVVSLSTAEEAVEELQHHRYDLLLTDYNLPNRNADWMLTVVQENGSMPRTRAIVLSGDSEPRGIDGFRFLQKPVDVDALFAALDDALAASRH
jgi:CheY-like chemotaxis protein